MRLFSKTTEFDFVGKRWIALVLSVTLIVISLAAISIRGLNLGLDFTGGTLVEVGYDKSVELDDVRNRLGGTGFGDALVQDFGTSKDVLIRIAPHEDLNSTGIGTRVMDALREGGQGVNLRRVEFVGPQVGDELTEDGGLAVIYALFGILIYVTIRFEKRFSLGAVIALIHDVTITVGMFAIFQFPFDLTVLAAILAVIGYSLNDTIVVFDRVRENFRKMRKADAVTVMNVSINETLSRTINTSLTTLLVLFALFLLGGEIIHGFSTALIIGIVVGTYSSIYVAGTSVLALGVSRADLVAVVVKDGVESDAQGRIQRG